MSLSDFEYIKVKDGYKITADDCSGNKVVFPEGVTEIGDQAFATNAKASFSFPVSLRRIGDSAFYASLSLKSVDLSACTELTHIGAYAFSDSSYITRVILPAGLKSLGDGAFNYVSSLTEIAIPSGIEKMGHEVFADCYALKKITVIGDKIPASWPKDWNGSDAKVVFSAPKKQASTAQASKDSDFLSAAKELKELDKSADKVSRMRDRALAQAKELEREAANAPKPKPSASGKMSKEEIKSALDSIDKRFQDIRARFKTDGTNNGSRTQATASASAQIKTEPQITYTRNSYYTPLDDFEITRTSDGLELGKPKRTLNNLTELILPPEITSIAPYAFYCGTFLPNLQKFKAGATLKKIGESAFSHSPWLYEIDFPNTVQLDENAFSYCERLNIAILTPYMGKSVYYNTASRVVSMPSGGVPITVIREQTFYGSKIRSIKIPPSVTRIEDGAFACCHELSSIELDRGQSISIGKQAFLGCRRLTEFTIPDNIQGNIQESTFAGCTGLKTLNLGRGRYTIEPRAMINAGVQELFVPRSVTLSRNCIGSPWLSSITFEGRCKSEVSTDIISKGFRFLPYDTKLICTDGVIVHEEKRPTPTKIGGWI